MTSEGNIFVDGVLASCYASADHDLAHIMITPMRWFPEAVEWTFRMEEGFSVYVEMVKILGEYIIGECSTELDVLNYE